MNKDDALKKFFNPKVRSEVWDGLDYINDLPEAEKEWMKKFMSEYANASIGVDKKGMPKKGHLHKTKKQKKSVFDANNKRNNDVFGVTKVNGLLEYDVNGLSHERDIWFETDPNSTEDALHWAIDYKNNKNATKREYRKRLKK